MFDRIMMTIRSNLGDMISRAEDPERLLNQVMIDMQTQLYEAKKQVAVVIADEKRLRRQAEGAAAYSREWERKAMLAVRAGDDNLAKAALARKAEHDQYYAAFAEQWQAQKKSVDTLRFALHGLSGKIEEAHRTRRILIARKRRADAQRVIAMTLSNMNVSSPLGILERMEERIALAEADAEASLELSGHPDPSLEAQFRALEAGNVEDQLAALKRKLALESAPDPRALPPRN